MSDRHWYGLRVPGGVTPVRKWGARAIYTVRWTPRPVRRRGRIVGHDQVPHYSVELLHDRQQYEGPDDEGKADFFEWLEKHGLTGLRLACKESGLETNEDRVLTVGTSGGAARYHLIANPNKSYGYLYICAWEDSHEPTQQGQ